MGSKVKRQKLKRVGWPIQHSVIVKDGVMSIETLCGIDVRTISAYTTGDATECAGCWQIKKKHVLVQWKPPKEQHGTNA